MKNIFITENFVLIMGIFTIENFIKSYLYRRNIDKRSVDNTIDEQIELQIVNYLNLNFSSNELKVLLNKLHGDMAIGSVRVNFLIL